MLHTAAKSNRVGATRAPVAAFSSSAMPYTRSSFKAQPLVSTHPRGNLLVRQAKKDGCVRSLILPNVMPNVILS